MRPVTLSRGSLFAAILACTLSAGAVSRIGGGMCSEDSGFAAEVPPMFGSGTEGEDGLLFFKSVPLMTGKGPVDQWIVAQDFKVQFATSLAGLDERAMAEGFSLKGYQPLPSRLGCVRTWRKETPTSSILVMVWGPRKGLALTGTKTPYVSEALEHVSQTLRLTDGACEWK